MTTTRKPNTEPNSQDKPEAVNGVSAGESRLDTWRVPPKTADVQPPPLKPSRRLGLRGKATLLALALGTLPVVVVGAITYWFAQRQLTEQIILDQRTDAIALEDELEIFMSNRYADAKVLSNLPSFVNPTLRATVAPEEITATLNNYAVSYKPYDSVALFDPNGNVIAQSEGEPVANLDVQQDYFQQAMQSQSTVISEPKLDAEAYRIYIAAPVVDALTNQTLFVVRLQIPQESLEELFESFEELGEEVYLVDASGTIFAAHVQEYVGRPLSTEFSQLSAQIQQQGGSGALEQPLTVIDTHPGGKEELLAFAPTEDLQEEPYNLRWGAIIARPTRAAFAPLRQMIWSFSLGTGATALIVGAIAAAIARRTVRPIVAYANTVNKIGQGKLDTRLAVGGNDELAILGHNINRMADQILALLVKQKEAAGQQIAAQEKLAQARAGEARLAQLMAEVARARSASALQSPLNQILAEIRATLNCDRILVYRFADDRSGTVISESVIRLQWPSAAAELEKFSIPEAEFKAYQLGQVVPVANVFEAGFSGDRLKVLKQLLVKSSLVVPVMQDEDLYGLLIAHHCSNYHDWQLSEIDTLKQTATQLGIALSAFSLLEQKQAEAQREHLLAEIANVRTSEALQSPLSQYLHPVRATLKAERVAVFKFDPYWMGAIVGESVEPGWTPALGTQINDPCFATDYVKKYQQGRILAIEDITEAQISDCYLQQLEPFEVKANLVVPIVVGSQSEDSLLFGLLIAHQCSKPRSWQPSEIDYLQNIAAQLAVNVSGMAFLERQQAEAQRERLLAEIANARTSEEIQVPLNQFLPEVRATLKTERVVVYKFNPDRSGSVIGESVESGWTQALDLEINDACIPGPLLEAYKTGRVVPTSNVFEAGFHPDHLQLMERLQIRANLVVPIYIGAKSDTEAGELFGLLIAHQCSKTRDWQPEEIEYLEGIAGRLAIKFSGMVLLERRQAEAQRERQQNERLQQDLLQLISGVEGASTGDLTVRAEITSGEIGIMADVFNAIIENLRDLVTQVKQAAAQVDHSVKANEGATSQLAAEALEQAAQISQTLDWVEQMAHSVQEVAQNARQAAEVARAASQTAATGGEKMERTVESIVELRDTVAQTAKKVKRLGESTQQISQVVSLINQIALKTNMLAINASIEAARAGEEGLGFAVVAEEVSELAAQSATATKDIEQVVKTIQRETGEVVEAMELGTTQVVEGTQLVTQTKQSLEQIVAVSRQIDRLLHSISTATVSQAQKSQSVIDLMARIAQVSDHTSQSSRQVSRSLQGTVEIAQQLQNSVGTFKLEDE